MHMSPHPPAHPTAPRPTPLRLSRLQAWAGAGLLAGSAAMCLVCAVAGIALAAGWAIAGLLFAFLVSASGLGSILGFFTLLCAGGAALSGLGLLASAAALAVATRVAAHTLRAGGALWQRVQHAFAVELGPTTSARAHAQQQREGAGAADCQQQAAAACAPCSPAQQAQPLAASPQAPARGGGDAPALPTQPAAAAPGKPASPTPPPEQALTDAMCLSVDSFLDDRWHGSGGGGGGSGRGSECAPSPVPAGSSSRASSVAGHGSHPVDSACAVSDTEGGRLLADVQPERKTPSPPAKQRPADGALPRRRRGLDSQWPAVVQAVG